MNNNDFKKFRHEYKYVITNAQSKLLENRIEHLLSHDRHTDDSNIYSIRSLYFDDYDNRCYYENENGTDPREKFRIRIYNQSSDVIKLECKRKERGMTFKESCPLTSEQTQKLMKGEILPDMESLHPLLRKLTLQMLCRKMHPVVIVDYDRMPFVYKDGNVRVTLDYNISSSNDIDKFFEREIHKRPIMPMGQKILEVKFDEFLPSFIQHNLQLDNLNRTAFSKYYLCRKFSF